MSIGLYDVDFFKYHQVMLNLEIMKMATYFKNRREITVLSPTFSPERYAKFYLRKDYYDGTFPAGLNKYQNLEYGGFAFTGNLYVPMNEEIEVCAPDLHVYDKYKDLFFENVKNHKAVYTSLTNNIHLRISLDEKTIWEPFEKQIPRGSKANILYFHDRDLGSIENSYETVEYLLNKYSRKNESPAFLGVKYPIICNTFNIFQQWEKLPFSEAFFTIQINELLEDEELVSLIENNTAARCQRIRYRIASSSSDKNDFIESVLPKIFKQVIFCCNHHKQISLIIDDDFRIEQKWRDLITLFNLYMRAAVDYTRVPALYRFCKALKPKEEMRKTGIMSKEEAKEIFLYVYNRHPELFKMFYECNQVHLEGGEFKID